MVGDGEVITYYVTLSERPLADVMVMATTVPTGLTIAYPGGGSELTFMRGDYDMEQEVMVTAPATVPTDPIVTVTFTASNGGYDNEKATKMFTVVEDDGLAPGNLKATAGGNFADPTVTLMWDGSGYYCKTCGL